MKYRETSCASEKPIDRSDKCLLWWLYISNNQVWEMKLFLGGEVVVHNWDTIDRDNRIFPEKLGYEWIRLLFTPIHPLFPVSCNITLLIACNVQHIKSKTCHTVKRNNYWLTYLRNKEVLSGREYNLQLIRILLYCEWFSLRLVVFVGDKKALKNKLLVHLIIK